MLSTILFIPVNWTDWAAFAQLLQFVIVIIALLYAKKEVGEVAKSRKLDATNILIDQIGNDEIRSIRSWFLHSNIDMDKLNDDEVQKIRKLAVSYDRIGFMIKEKYLPEKALFLWQKDEIAAIWDKSNSLIYKMRTENNRGNYCIHFEYLANEWLKKMQKKNI